MASDNYRVICEDESGNVVNDFIYSAIADAKRVARDHSRIEGRATIYKNDPAEGEIVAVLQDGKEQEIPDFA